MQATVFIIIGVLRLFKREGRKKKEKKEEEVEVEEKKGESGENENLRREKGIEKVIQAKSTA